MRTYTIATIVIATLVLISFLVVEALDIPLLTDPSGYLDDAGLLAGVLSVGLLLVDVFIPVPSSFIMIANGAMFGVVGGTLLTLVGAVGGAMIGFLVGRRGAGLIRRFVSPEEQRRADALIAGWGIMAIIVTRPIPILAETVAVMVGTTAIGWQRVLVASTLGIIPAAVIYAIAGAYTTDLASGAVVTVIVVVIAALAWVVGRRLESRFVHDSPDSASSTM